MAITTEALPAETIEIGNRNKLVGKHELLPMPRLKPIANFHTATTTNCGSQRELTAYSFQSCLTIPIRSFTTGRLMPPARSRWPIAVLVPSIEICNNKPQSLPLNNFSSLCRYLQHTEYQRKCDIGKWPWMHRPRKPSKLGIGANWSARWIATDVKAKTKGQLPHHN